MFDLLPELASDGLKGRVFECALADIHKDDTAYRKFKLMVEEIQGRNCLTNFHGMSLTTDRIRSLVKKWQVRLMRTTESSNALWEWKCMILLQNWHIRCRLHSYID